MYRNRNICKENKCYKNLVIKIMFNQNTYKNNTKN